MTTRDLRAVAAALAGSGLILALSACGSTATTTALESAAASVPASTVASVPASAVASSSGTSQPLNGPCDLLTGEQIASATGVSVGDGAENVDEARQIQMCTWQSTDPFLIVAASLTDVAADEAFKTNVDLAPAYFDGEAVDVTLPGADKAYAVEQPDVGWVVGAIAKGRFVQVQVGGTGVTQEQASRLVQDAISRMPAAG